MRVVACNLFDTPNVGDQSCNPVQFLPINARMHPLYGIEPLLSQFDENDTLILGGGAICKKAWGIQTKARKVLWGAGYTTRYSNVPIRHPQKYVDTFVAYGTRDDIGVGDYVPCPSCMSRNFDNPPGPEHPIVFYGHAKVKPLRPTDKRIPYLDNAHLDFSEVIQFLASGEHIVTSSYHGMYWGLLLGRRVTVLPFGTKFNHLRWKASFETIGQGGKSAPFALEEARELNLNFLQKLRRLELL